MNEPSSVPFIFLRDKAKPLRITVNEIYDADYSLYTWPSAVVLAQYIWYHWHDFEARTVLELGCGTSLPGLTAGKLGSKVILADRFCDWRSKKLVVKTCHENNFSVSPCIWQEGCNLRKFGKKEQEEHHKPSKRVTATARQTPVADGTVASSSSASNDPQGNTAIEDSSTDADTSTTAIWANSGDYCYCNPCHDDSSGTPSASASFFTLSLSSSFPSSSSSVSSSSSSLPLTRPVIELMQLTWGQFTPDVLSIEDASLDFVLASDCFYDTSDFDDIVATVYFLLRVKGKPNCTFLTSYQERTCDWSIDCLLDRFNLKGCEIPLESFEASQPQLLGSRLPGSCTVSLFKISLK